MTQPRIITTAFAKLMDVTMWKLRVLSKCVVVMLGICSLLVTGCSTDRASLQQHLCQPIRFVCDDYKSKCPPANCIPKHANDCVTYDPKCLPGSAINCLPKCRICYDAKPLPGTCNGCVCNSSLASIRGMIVWQTIKMSRKLPRECGAIR